MIVTPSCVLSLVAKLSLLPLLLPVGATVTIWGISSSSSLLS
jgi:hypothetical protein